MKILALIGWQADSKSADSPNSKSCTRLHKGSICFTHSFITDLQISSYNRYCSQHRGSGIPESFLIYEAFKEVSCGYLRFLNQTRVVLQLLSCVRLFATPWTAARQVSLSFTMSQSLLKFTSIESVMPSNHLIFSRPLLVLPSIFPSTRVFSNESALLIRWPKFLEHQLQQQSFQ